jgi:Ca-activated chloride channel family protein
VNRGILFAPLSRLPVRGATWQTAARWIGPVLVLAGMALCVVALSRPQTVLSHSRRQADAIAIEMVTDVSGSMQALDLSTRDAHRNRLDVVKDTFAQFVNERPDDLIGLVTFGGFAVTRVPLTIDHEALLRTLRAVEIPKSTYDANGQVLNSEELLTAIGDALATASARLRGAEVKSRIIVLLSDGESNTGVIKPDEAARAAKALGIKVYTIGVGSTGRAPFIMKDMFGRDAIGYAEVTLDEDQLRRIASATGGRYFNVRDPQGLRKAMDDINKLERTRINREVYEQYSELFPYWLIPAAVLLVLGAWLNIVMVKAMI